jgi:predicted Zn-dependent protease
MSDFQGILDRVVTVCENRGAEAEVYGTRKRETIVSLERNDVKLSVQQIATGIGIRTLINNSLGFACCNSLDEGVAKEAAERAVRMSRKTPPTPFSGFASPRVLPEIKGLYDPEVQDFDGDAAICAARTMLSVAREDPRVSVNSGEVFVSEEERALSTSTGISAAEKRSRISWFLIGMAREKGEVGSSEYHYGCTTRVREACVEKTAKMLAENVVAHVHPERIDSFSGDVILGPDALSTIAGESFPFAVNANNIYQKQSAVAGRVGEKIASDVVTIQDDSTLPGDYNSSRFDREGLPHQVVTMVEKGFLKEVMYDTLAANREGRLSTGNAGGSFGEMPRIDITNFIVETSSRTLETLVEETEKGLLVSRFDGVCDNISGDFSGVVKGAQLIESGEITYPVKEVSITGNLFELLLKVCDVSQETMRYPKMVLPYVKVCNMQFIC